MTSVRDSPVGPRRSPALGAAFLAAQTLSLNAISLLSTAFIVRKLGSLRYGEWATAAALAAAHQVITNIGLRTLFVREVARRPAAAGELLTQQLGLRLGLGVLACASAMTVCLLVGYPPVVLTCMAVGCVGILLSVVGTTLGDVLQALERFGAYSIVGVVSGLAVTAASVVAVLAGGGAVALTIAYLTQPLVSACLLWSQARWHVHLVSRWNWASAKRQLIEARFLGANSVASAAADNAVGLLVPAIVGLERFGVFSAGTIVADRLRTIPDAVGTAFYPSVSRSAAQSREAGERSVVSMLTIGIAACAPMAIAGVYVARPIAAILLPHDVLAGQMVIQVTVLALPLTALAIAMLYSLQAAGHYDTAARLGIGASLVSVVTSAACVVTAGTTGASWAFVAKPAILAVALIPAFHKVFPRALARPPWVRILIASSALAAICHLARNRNIVGAMAYSAAGFGVYGAGLLAMRVFSVSDLFGLLSRTDQR